MSLSEKGAKFVHALIQVSVLLSISSLFLSILKESHSRMVHGPRIA